MAVNRAWRLAGLSTLFAPGARSAERVEPAAPSFGVAPSVLAGGELVARASGYHRPRVRGEGFKMAGADRLTASWGLAGRTTDLYLRAQLRAMQFRARDLVRNNDYAKRFVALLLSNVIGPAGIRLQMAVKRPRGAIDLEANEAVESAWREWGAKGSPTVDGRLSWLEAQQLFMRLLPRDGEVLVRKLPGVGGGRFNWSFQFLAPELLDPTFETANLPDGGFIRMSIEFNRFRRPVAYHFLTRHPDGNPDAMSGGFAFAGGSWRVRVPAAEVIHAFVMEDTEQSRGIPWMVTPATRLQMLGGYEEAELVASRASAGKMGFYKKSAGAGDPPSSARDETTGDFIQEAEAGTFEIVPAGYEVDTFDPQHPNAAFQAFVKTVLRGASAGLNVSYNMLANDGEGVNFSSIRSFVLEDRDAYRALQAFTIENFCGPIFGDWLRWSLALDYIAGYGVEDLARLAAAPTWRARGWKWVDPSNDMQAAAGALALGTTTRTRLAAEQGEDFEELLAERKSEAELAARYGIVFIDPPPPGGKTDAAAAAASSENATGAPAAAKPAAGASK